VEVNPLPETSARPRAKRWRRVLLGLAVASPVAIGGLWYGVHHVPWLGPLVANSLRATVGTDNVAALEDFVYGLEDRFNQVWRKGEKPKAYWNVPDQKAASTALPEAPPAPDAQPEPGQPSAPALPRFTLPDPGPMHEVVAAPGDGQWVPMVDSRHPDDPPRMLKMLLHPDKSRSWAELFVVALDLRQVEVHPVVGYQEPASEAPEAQKYERFAKIPEKHYEDLLAAFNGGFMAEHGHYGMRLDGVEFLPPRPDACTLAQYDDGSFRVGTWKNLAADEARMTWFRQAPPCMAENEKLNPLLSLDRPTKWGATLDGNTVIRRSAVGMDASGQVLFVSITNHTTAPALAKGMRHAGAVSVAQMDVNWSYPKFVTYEPVDGKLTPKALADGFEFSSDLYLRERAMRDFFYITRKTSESAVAANKPTAADDAAAPTTASAPTEAMPNGPTTANVSTAKP
jgi:hypothetical protein